MSGSLVLGQVSRIFKLGLEVSLPNNLTGYVSIVSVSEQLNDRLKSDDSQDEEEEDPEEPAEVRLQSIFRVGQYLRLSPVSSDSDGVNGKRNRKIELTLNPRETNGGLGNDDLVGHATVMATVMSDEDRGYVMDLGITHSRAFLSRSEIDDDFEEERLQVGAVFLCQIRKVGSKGKVVQLSLRQQDLGNVNKVPIDATTINTFLPGTPVDLLVTSTDRGGLCGKIIGHLDAVADMVHSGSGPENIELDTVYKIGSKVKARVICNYPMSKDPKLGVSLLSHIKALEPKRLGANQLPLDLLPISSVVEKCKVRSVESDMGLFVDVEHEGLGGFVHISRVKDGKVDALYELSGPFQVESIHRGRITGYSAMDGIFQVSFQKTVLEQQYIRREDVPIGAVVSCEIEKVLITEVGVGGLILKITDKIGGLVTERHMSDIRLQHPEKKFREGMKVKARVLSVDLAKKQIRLTLKKTLVNSDVPPIKKLGEATIGMRIPGTIVKLLENGAIIQFYGSLKGFLPIAEMSEAYIKDPSEHFRLGQVVSVHVLEVDVDANRLILSCKDPDAFGLDKQAALKSLQVGDLVSAKVTQKTEEQLFLELDQGQLKASLPVGHLTDKSESKNRFALKRLAVGQTLTDLAVIDKDEKRRSIVLTQKPSLVQACTSKTLLHNFEDAKVDDVVPGYVRNVTSTAIFVQLGGGLRALVPKSRLPHETQALPNFGLQKHQSVEIQIVNLIQDLQRIVAVFPTNASNGDLSGMEQHDASGKAAQASLDELVTGSITKARVTSIKSTQLNVQILGSQVQGRVDVSQVFDNWDEIFDHRNPLGTFHKKQVIRVRVLGVHDAKDHKFLAFSHRSAHSVLELSVKPSDLIADTVEPLAMSSMHVSDTHLAFVNNVSPQFLWVNISPNIRGRISLMEATDDISQLNDPDENFPVGSALKVRVVAVDAQNSHLDLSARPEGASNTVVWSSLKPNMVLPGKITKINERQIMVQLSDSVSGPVHLPDMFDNFDETNTMKFRKNEVVRVSVVEVDASNKRLRLSTRPSRILSSTLPVADKEIIDWAQISSGSVMRGFVKNVSDKGLFVLLGGQVTALVKISNLSDRYIKEWKDHYQIDQLVKGRVISADTTLRQAELSLKASVVDEDYRPLKDYGDFEEGQIVTGKVRKVEVFGAFILVDDSANVSGLCHRSQMAEKPVQDATKLFREGDVVKAMILEVDTTKRRISFGLKASLFDDNDDSDDSMASDASGGGAALITTIHDDGEDNDDDDGSLVDAADNDPEIQIMGTDNIEDSSSQEEDAEPDSEGDVNMRESPNGKVQGLRTGKKADWLADPFQESTSRLNAQSSKLDKSKKGSGKTNTPYDRTAELDVNGPQTSSDYERLLLGQPDSSTLWIAYMAFQMQVSELNKAREVAERALKTINIREETEKFNVWVAFLNLEVTYGTKRSVEEIFKRACQYNDDQEVHERLASIYIQSENLKVGGLLSYHD